MSFIERPAMPHSLVGLVKTHARKHENSISGIDIYDFTRLAKKVSKNTSGRVVYGTDKNIVFIGVAWDTNKGDYDHGSALLDHASRKLEIDMTNERNHFNLINPGTCFQIERLGDRNPRSFRVVRNDIDELILSCQKFSEANSPHIAPLISDNNIGGKFIGISGKLKRLGNFKSLHDFIATITDVLDPAHDVGAAIEETMDEHLDGDLLTAGESRSIVLPGTAQYAYWSRVLVQV